MGFYDQGKLHFVDERGQVYRNVAELIVAEFGSRAHYVDMLVGMRKRAEEDRKWREAHHPVDSSSPLRNK